MNDRIIITSAFVIITLILILILIINTQNTKPMKSQEQPKFNILGVSMSKKPGNSGKTENYTSDELAEISKQVEFTYKFSIESGVDLIKSIKCSRTHGTYSDIRNIDAPVSKNTIYEFKFTPKEGENVVGTHTFTLSFDSNTLGDGNIVATGESIINANQLSRVIDANEIQELTLVDVGGDNELITSITKRRVIIKYDDINIFGEEDVYLSPLVNDTDNGVCIKKFNNETNITNMQFPTEIRNCTPLYVSKYQGKTLISTSSTPSDPDAKFLTRHNYTRGPLENYNYKGLISGQPYWFNRYQTEVYYGDDREYALKNCSEACDAYIYQGECKGFVIENGFKHNGGNDDNALTCKLIDSPTNNVNSRTLSAQCGSNNIENLWNDSGKCTKTEPRGTPNVLYNDIKNGLYWNEKKRTNQTPEVDTYMAISAEVSYKFETLESGSMSNKLFTLEFPDDEIIDIGFGLEGCPDPTSPIITNPGTGFYVVATSTTRWDQYFASNNGVVTTMSVLGFNGISCQPKPADVGHSWFIKNRVGGGATIVGRRN